MCSYQTVVDMYPRYLDSLVANISDDHQCQQQCSNNRAFACRAYSFYASGSQCFISSDDRSKYYLLTIVCYLKLIVVLCYSFRWAVSFAEPTWNKLYGAKLQQENYDR